MFDRTGDAVAAAAAIVAELKAMTWDTSEPVLVRVGVHTGETEIRDADYYGTAVNLCARLRGLANPSQILLSETSARLVEALPPDGVTVRDVGMHRLKGLRNPERVFQLCRADLDDSFPALISEGRHNLPAAMNSFVGRAAELVAVTDLLVERRLVTLTGAGGSGKTRLALEVAASLLDQFVDGVWFVELAIVTDAAFVADAIAAPFGVQPTIDGDIVETLRVTIGSGAVLVVVDNCEHVVAATAVVIARLLGACPGLRVLATSQEPLSVAGETTNPVAPLAVPDPTKVTRPFELMDYEAVKLFVERAAATRAGFTLDADNAAAVAQICARLDGIPLALELAAARVRSLSPAQIAARLDDRFKLLIAGPRTAPARHQTLRATIDWSYQLLNDDEQRVLRRLAVFVGGCSLDAAEAVCASDEIERDDIVDILGRLVDRSLVVADTTTADTRLRFSLERYWMLGTIREYAAERLDEAGDSDRVRSRHASRHARIAMELAGPMRDRSAEALAVLDAEHDNMRAALDFTLERDDVVTAGELLDGLWCYWLMTGRGGEAAMWANRYLASSRERTAPLDRYGSDGAVAEILRFTGDPETATQIKREMVATGRAHPDALINGVPIAGLTAATLSDLAWIELGEGRMEAARSDAQEALMIRRNLGLPGGIAHALTALAGIAFHEGDYGLALELAREAAETAPLDSDSLECRLTMTECELLLGRLNEARALVRVTFPAITALSDATMELHALRVVGMFAAASGQAETSAALFGASDRMLHDTEVRVFTDYELALHGLYLGRARDALEELVFAAAYERGHEAPRDEVISLALSALE